MEAQVDTKGITGIDVDAFLADLLEPGSLCATEMLDYAEEQRLEDNRQRRMEVCGSWAWSRNQTTRECYSYHIHCGYWRHCDKCFAKRVKMFEERFGSIPDPFIYQGTSKEISKLTRKIRRLGGQYWRIPTEDYTILITLTDIGPSDLQAEDLDWQELARTPEGRSYSGKLGRTIEDEENQGEYILVNVIDLAVDGIDHADQVKAMQEAERMNLGPAPDWDADELSYEDWRIKTTFKDIVVKMGGTVTYETTRREKVYKEAYLSLWDRDKLTLGQENEGEKVPQQPAQAFDQAKIDRILAELFA